MRVFKYLLILAFTCLQCASALTLEEVQNNLLQYPVVQANFTQLKTIKGMNLPLKSSGILILSQKQGIVWQQQKPFAMHSLLTSEKMQLILGDQVQTITKEQNPQLFNFTQLLTAIFMSDRAMLEQNFDFTFEELPASQAQQLVWPQGSKADSKTANNNAAKTDTTVAPNSVVKSDGNTKTNPSYDLHDLWSLTLKPKQAPLNKIFDSINLFGSKVILKIVLNDKQGDSTTIYFSQHQLSQELSLEQAKLFK